VPKSVKELGCTEEWVATECTEGWVATRWDKLTEKSKTWSDIQKQKVTKIRECGKKEFEICATENGKYAIQIISCLKDEKADEKRMNAKTSRADDVLSGQEDMVGDHWPMCSTLKTKVASFNCMQLHYSTYLHSNNINIF